MEIFLTLGGQMHSKKHKFVFVAEKKGSGSKASLGKMLVYPISKAIWAW
jgi:hypothetical protein